jgi:LAO/AO transport system kinase
MEELVGRKKCVYPSFGFGRNIRRCSSKTRETITLCEAAFDTIIIETVGVGQSETVHSMVDFFLY